MIRTLLIPFLFISTLTAVDPFLVAPPDDAQIIIHNRILARVNGKSISVMDVAKKMDLLFLRTFPQYASSNIARYQYYEASWKQMLNDAIDKELILADADENKFKVTSGDIRQEMEMLFGPHVIANLHQINMNIDEAQRIVEGDIILRRMTFARVNGKAIRSVTPQSIRQAYDAFVKENPVEETWTYRVVSIRHPDEKVGAQTAEKAYTLLNEQKTPPNELSKQLKGEKLSVNVSDNWTHKSKEISAPIMDALAQLEAGGISSPLVQKSRADRSIVYRIILLNSKTEAGAIPFSQVENQIRDELISKAIADEGKKYLERLHKHFDIQISYTDDFEPFTLRE